MPSPNVTTIFNDQWESYQWLIDCNIMGHKELLGVGREWVIDCLNDKPVSMTDLGCGNSMLVPDLVDGISLDSYCGVDLAGNALALSRALLNKNNINAHHFQQSFFDDLPDKALLSNLVYSAFAVHHGSGDMKRQLLESLCSQTPSETLFLLIDVACYPGQSRQDYCQMLEHHFQDHQCRQDWLVYFMDHITHFDYPETEETG